MAFPGGVRRAVNVAVLGLVFAGAGAASFYFFEDFYRALEKRFPGLEASVEHGQDDPQVVSSTPATSDWRTETTTPEITNSTSDLRSSVIDLDSGRDKSALRSVTLKANAYGHYIVEAEINGGKVELLTDTGATYVALNYQTALQIGFTPQTLQFTSRSTTANGIARVAPVNLDFLRVGGIVLRDVKAVVAEPGKMTQNLLGMSFINRLSGFELSGGRLVMLQKSVH
jgi:aspartyl protease family protein